MITSPAFAGKRYAVLGLARSGAATVDALLASGASVMAWDGSVEVRSKFLPGTGRGTMRSMVEGAGDESAERASRAPSTTAFGGGPPPREAGRIYRTAPH